MRSEGRNLDLYKNSPQRMLERAIQQLETAKVDPNFYGVVKKTASTFIRTRLIGGKRYADKLERL